MERHGDAPARLDRQNLAVGGHGSVGIHVPDRRANRPVGRDTSPVVIANGVVAVRDRPPDPLRRGLDEGGVDVIDRVHRSLQVVLQVRHGAHDRLGELADPAVVHETDRNGVQEMALHPADLDGRQEVRVFEDREVLHHPETGHLGQVLAQLSQRLAIALEEPIEQDPPTRVGERSKDRCHGIRHARDYM
jgi:hypothetical protein